MNRIARAREVLPLPRLLQKLGLGIHATKNTECPFCHARKKFGVYESKAHGGHWFFKCYNNECAANDADGGHSEIGFLILHNRCSDKDAIDEFIRLATEVDPSLADTKLYHTEIAPTLGGGRILTETTEPLNPWHDAWQRFPLNADHNEALRKKRGFTEATIKALGYRSSIAANENIADALLEKWGERALIELGIVKNEKEGLKLNPQLHGLGITGKKDADGENKMGWVNPIIIPYLDAEGVPFYLRPHKGGLKRQHRDQWFKEQAGGSVYCPYLLASLIEENNGVCIVTEGEFKAGALWQCRIPALAVPGIQFTRSKAGDISMPEYRFRNQLVALLKKFGVTDVIVAFDNEIKDDAALPSYKPDPNDRYDTIVWAEYLAWDLCGEFESVRIGHIPDAWRIDGKADFDSALAGFVHGAMSGKAKHPAFDFGHGEKEGTRKARKAFRAIIDDSQEKKGYHELFASAARKIIDCKLERLFYTPRVPSGGDLEEKLARRFAEPDPINSKPGKPVAIDAQLAAAFKSVIGCYYKRASVEKSEVNSLRALIQTITAQIEAEENTGNAVSTKLHVFNADDPTVQATVDTGHLQALRSQKAAAWERLKGMPEPLSDFTIICEFKLHRTDGTVARLVRIRQKQGQTNSKLFSLNGEAMSRTSNFRRWVYDTGLGVPMFGEKDLQLLVADLDHHSAFRDIHQINAYGLHEPTRLWVYSDASYAPGGVTLKTDEYGNIWHEGLGYQVEEQTMGEEISTGFEQGAPKVLSPHEAVPPLEISDVTLLEHISEDFHGITGYDGWLALGTFFAAACAPEMFALHKGQPGLFIHGTLSSGKTETMRLLMRLHGFKDTKGMNITGSTEVAMGRALSHYSCLAVWFDEHRDQYMKDHPGKDSIMRDSFSRGGAAKGSMGDPTKTRMVNPKTTCSVTGESSPSDSATRSRFCIINVSAVGRSDHSKKCWAHAQTEAPHYYRIWGYIMANREQFAALTMGILAQKMEKYKAVLDHPRILFVYMAAFSAFAALHRLMETSLADNFSGIDPMDEFEAVGIRQAIVAKEGVSEESYQQTFFNDLINGLQDSSSGIKRHLFEMKVVGDGMRQCTEDEIKSGVGKQLLLVNYGPVYAAYLIYIRKQGKNAPQSAGDLKENMSKEKWFIKERSFTVRFKGGGDDGSSKPTRPLIISMEEEDGFPFIGDFMSILSKSEGITL